MYKSLSGARVTGTESKPRLHLMGSTWRGTGVEYVDTNVDLRTLLVEMAKDPDLRPVLLGALLQADIEQAEERRRTRESLAEDRDVLEDWLDELEPDELFVVLHRHQLGGLRRRYWFYPAVDDPDAAYARAVHKLPKGIGPSRLEDLVDRYQKAVTSLMSTD